MSATRFLPGAATGIVADDVVVLTTGPADRLVEVVGRGDHAIDDLLAPELPTVAVALIDGSRVTVVARGAATVEVDDRASVVDDRGEFERVRQLAVRLGGVPASDVVDSPFTVERGVVPAAALRRELDAPDGDLFDTMFGHTVVRSVEAAAMRSAPAPPVPLGVLVFSTGERVTVDGALVLGRNPTADRGRARPVKLSGAGVSRRHALVTVDRWQACVDDLGSSNGTDVTLPGGVAHRVEPGHPVGLVAGARVDLGGDVSFVLEDVA